MAALRKLIALDEDDLAVISAHVQDAEVHAADILWRPGEKRLVIGMRRPDCDQMVAGIPCDRHLISALRFERVLSCKARNLSLDSPEESLELLGLEFYPGKKPGGCVVLMFTEGSMLRLDVECIECELADLAVVNPCTSGLDADEISADTEA
ncbi:MAG: DUF2948 family protein [Bradyrhizobiaceae bacterium]|nr:MAG: DUF2948 family protein [Bradyrhizobiaceae bacterium]